MAGILQLGEILDITIELYEQDKVGAVKAEEPAVGARPEAEIRKAQDRFLIQAVPLLEAERQQLPTKQCWRQLEQEKESNPAASPLQEFQLLATEVAQSEEE